MAIIYNIFTKQVITLESIESVQAPVVSSMSVYETAKERILARFGDELPKHFAKYYATDELVDVPYLFGCVHNVSYKRVRPKTQRARRFNNPIPIPANLDAETDFLGRGVRYGTECDPFAWMDMKYGITLDFLKRKANGSELHIETRSDLIACDDYLNELRRLNVIVTMYLGDADANECRQAEPGAPSNSRRMKTVNKLKEYNIPVEVVCLDRLGNERPMDIRDQESA